MQRVNYHHLYYFLTIAHEGSVSNASKKLRLGQPTLSAQLKCLEESLGIDLFERKNKRLILTEEGEMVLQYANEIFAIGDEMQGAIRDGTFNKRSHLHIGVLESLPKRLIYQLVSFARKSRNCSTTVLEGDGDYLLRELSANRIDLCLTNYPPAVNMTELFNAKLLASVPISIFGTRKFRNLKANFPQSLNSQPFILPTLHSKLRHDLGHYFRANGILVDVVIETQDTSVQKLLGTEGMGLAPLPDFAGKELVDEKKLINIGTLPQVKEDFWLISSIRKIPNPLAIDLMENFSLSI
jgi:LysR family transcriptional regulator, transcriptional activator of nhaA